MTTQDTANRLAQLRWFKSSYSGSGGGDCVEVAAAPGAVRVRDSKHGRGPVLHFTAEEWVTFVDFARATN